MSISSETNVLFEHIARGFDLSEAGSAYADRHGVKALSRLTVTTDEIASLLTERLRRRIEGRTVVDLGAGIGILGLHMASIAGKVLCIEANPLWASTFVELLLDSKPVNLSFLFGSAQEFVGMVQADVAVICTHSDIDGLMRLGRQFAPVVIDVYGELIDENPSAFDALARRARR